MYVVVMAVNLATRFERMRWRQAVERERELQRERVELSQAIHDTVAQSAYMLGLGIDTAKALAGDANPELTATLEAASRLSRSVILELRHPINVGGIYEGRELSRALRSHATSFTNVTSVPVEMTHTGVEPPLSIEARSLLFSIAHNALTNAYRHAKANRVAINLEFAENHSRLSVADDGVGLPGHRIGQRCQHRHSGERRNPGNSAECTFLDTGLRRCDEGFCSFRLRKLIHCRLPKQTLRFSIM